MFHFLARVGKSRYAPNIVPAASAIVSLGYLGAHTVMHDQIRKLFSAQSPDGHLIPLSDYLRNLITDVFQEVEKAGFHVDPLNIKLDYFKQPPIRWFASSTVDPIVYGMTEYSTGVSIGIPNSYNFQRLEDLPDSLFEVKKLALIRSPQGGEEEKQKQLDSEALLAKQDTESIVTVLKIDRKSNQGLQYANSFLLTENAKRFSIARELYIADSYRPFVRTMSLMISMILGITVARLHVKHLNLNDRHVTHRMPGYFLSTVLAFGIHFIVSSSADDYFAQKANEKARKLGELYNLGADEYFTKQAKRDQFLR